MFDPVLSKSGTPYVIGGALVSGAILTIGGYFGHSDPAFATGIALLVVGGIGSVLKVNYYFKIKRVAKAMEDERTGHPIVEYIPPPTYVESSKRKGGAIQNVTPYNGHVIKAVPDVCSLDDAVRGSVAHGDYENRMEADHTTGITGGGRSLKELAAQVDQTL